MQMKSALPAVVAAALIACNSATLVEPVTSFAQFEARLETLRADSHISAISVAIARDQSIVYSRGFGLADIGEQRLATAATVYHLASLTKPFASVVIMQLVEEGRVSLDDAVSKYGINLPSSGVIRVRHLLSHTSEGSPGTSYSYNGDRFSLLDSVIARATGQTFAQAVQTRVIARIGLEHTAPGSQMGMARGYTWKDGKQVPTSYPSMFSTAAGLTGSAVDYARFSIAMDRDALLTPAAKAVAYAPAVLSGGVVSPYALGWFSTEYKGVRVIWHYGYWIANSSLVIKIPSRGLTYVVLSNSDQLSARYPLASGNLEQSPWAAAFLDAFISGDVPLP